MRHCVQCGSTELVTGTVEERIDVGGVAFTADVPGERCATCGEHYVSAADLERFELAASVELARIGERNGTALRFMRKALGFRAKDLAELLGVAPETFSRWETGERDPDAHAFALVGSLAADRLEGTERTASMLHGSTRGPVSASRSAPVRVVIRAA